MDTPPAEERRALDVGSLITLIHQLHDDIKALDAKLSTHISEEMSEIGKAIDMAFIASMPGGDSFAHRKIHEDMARTISDRADFWHRMLFEVTKFGAIGAVSWLVYTLWVAFIHGPTK
jgi:hypothetical protein